MAENPLVLLAAILFTFVVGGILALVGSFGWLPGTSNSIPTSSVTAVVAAPTHQSAPAASPTATVAAGVTLTVTAKNVAFDPTTLNAPAGGIGIDFRNEDAGTTHNIHFFKGNDASGQSVALTKVTSGPDEQRISFSADAGQYFYHCDIHVDQMQGHLTVQ